jgi:hypothetical protein
MLTGAFETWKLGDNCGAPEEKEWGNDFYRMDSRFMGKAVVALMSSVPNTNCVILFKPMPHPECRIPWFS